MKDFILFNQVGKYLLMVLVLIFAFMFSCVTEALKAKVSPGALRTTVTVVLGALLIIGCFGPLFAWAHFRNKAVRAKMTAEAPATVFKIKSTMCGSLEHFEAMYLCTAVHYRHQKDGQDYEGATGFTGNGAEKFKEGEVYKICYDPANPENKLIHLLTDPCGI